VLDALARGTSVSAADVHEIAAMHPGARWSTRVATALDLVDAGAESVRESQLRVVLVQAGLPRPVTQYTIRTSAGYFVARVDLAWPHLQALVEYDGAHHDERRQIVRDRGRMNALRLVGWSALVIDRAQFARRDAMVAMVRTLLVAAGTRS
jgi:very-short-patch-repair endonuclease